MPLIDQAWSRLEPQRSEDFGIKKGWRKLVLKIFKISSSCSIITSYHRIMDSVRENRGTYEIETTGKGIGPAYEDKISRKGIKVSDLFNQELLLTKLERNFIEKKVLLDHYLL